MYACVYVRCVYVYVCVYVYMYACMHVCMYVCVHISMYSLASLLVCMCECFAYGQASLKGEIHDLVVDELEVLWLVI